MNIYSPLNQLLERELYLKKKKKPWKTGGIFILTVILFFPIIFGSNSLSQELNLSFIPEIPLQSNLENAINLTLARDVLLKNEKEGRVNFLILGVSGEGHPAPFLTDAIMIVSLQTHQTQSIQKLTFISIPRDLLIKVPETNYLSRINSLYVRGQNNTDLIKKSITEITGLPIHYFLVIDLNLLKNFVDEIRGVDIFVEKEVYDPLFPEPNYSYQAFRLEKGWHHLDGSTAIKYVRTRHSPKGDFDRMDHQQKLIKALIDKLSSSDFSPNFSLYFKLFQDLENTLWTDLNWGEIKHLINLGKKLDIKNINYKVLDNSSGLICGGQIILGEQNASVLWPCQGRFDYSEIQKEIQNIISN